MSDTPISFEELRRRVEDRPALQDPPEDALRQSFFVAGREPVVRTEVSTVVEGALSSEDGIPVYRVDVELERKRIGVHAFAPGLKGEPLSPRRKLHRENEFPQHLEGYLPDHLARRTVPKALDKQLRVPRRLPSGSIDDRTRWATTVFPPDDRFTFNDTGFPWCSAGRVETAGGVGSGVMVGPRHLLTVSHVMQWVNPPNPFVAGWLKFTPSYFDGSEPFGVAWATDVYWQRQVDPPTIDGTEAQYDYVVVVLDRNMGALTGWMGSRTYDDGWDGGNYWSHIGYPGDLAGSQRPSFQGDFSLDGDDSEPSAHEAMYHTADVWPGQSGGPMFGWWDGEPWPRVVSVQSWQSSDRNGASGGGNMIDLIIRARNEHP